MSKGNTDGKERTSDKDSGYSDEGKRTGATASGSGARSSNDGSAGADVHHARTVQWSVYVEDDARIVNEWITVWARTEGEAFSEARKVTTSKAMEIGVKPDFIVHVALKMLTGSKGEGIKQEDIF
tara:strand:- start:225 stop:599 length:375 start_codon:yes stop_codon:yes gene_type:complete